MELPPGKGIFSVFSKDDLRALSIIKRITSSGHSAEVKLKCGKLAVYDVEKTKKV